MKSHPLLPGTALLLLASCSSLESLEDRLGVWSGATPVTDPTVEIRTDAGSELGVSTDYGVVFLGSLAQTGSVDLVAWFGDGPSFEIGVVEAVGSGIYLTDTEIRLPTVGLAFEVPSPGSKVLVRGRRGTEAWEEEAEITTDPRVEGVLLKAQGRLAEIGESQVGAGVYVGPPGSSALLGLVSGRLRLRGQEGWRDYVTVVGPESLWRLVTYRRNFARQRRWVYRDDIL